MHDNYWEAYETAAPMVEELVETGTISQETIAMVLPADSKFQGKELKPVGKVLGVKVGEERKQAIKEKEEKREAKEQAKQEKALAKEVAKAEKQVAKEQAKEEKAKEEETKELEEKIQQVTKQIQQSATGKDMGERDGSLY
jgi:septal ring factor EnvC (AmiA/AmiB activator)